LEKKLKLIIACGPLDDETVNVACRELGIYPHHIKQWTQGFGDGDGDRAKAIAPSETKKLKHEKKS
jgi:transposase-like protein